jgi:hypothetical protein
VLEPLRGDPALVRTGGMHAGRVGHSRGPHGAGGDSGRARSPSVT